MSEDKELLARLWFIAFGEFKYLGHEDVEASLNAILLSELAEQLEQAPVDPPRKMAPSGGQLSRLGRRRA